MASKKLYKFYSFPKNDSELDNFIQSIFFRSQIRFSNPCVLNDPFECKTQPWIPKNSRESKKYAQKSLIHKKLSRPSRRNIANILSAQPFEKYYEESHYVSEKQFRDNIYITSFASDTSGVAAIKNLLMWAHYTDSHRGFCIEVDEDIIKEQFNKDAFLLSYVNYKNEMPLIESSKYDEKLVYETFFTKSLQWEYEGEFRVVEFQDQLKLLEKPYTQSHKIFDKFYFNKVYLGCNIDVKIKDRIIKACSYKENVVVFQSKISNNKYELEFYQL